MLLIEYVMWRHHSPAIDCPVLNRPVVFVCDVGVLWPNGYTDRDETWHEGHIVLDGDPAPQPQNGHIPQFSAHVYCGQTAGWIKMPLGGDVDFGHMT